MKGVFFGKRFYEFTDVEKAFFKSGWYGRFIAMIVVDLRDKLLNFISKEEALVILTTWL